MHDPGHGVPPTRAVLQRDLRPRLRVVPPLPSVVLVDDAAEVRALLRVQLRLGRIADVVGEGSDGTAAVELARRHRPHLMVLDLSMPTLDGLGALDGVRGASPGTHVVVYSGFAEPGIADAAIQRGAAAFVQKTTDPAPLLDELRRLAALSDAGGSTGTAAAQDQVPAAVAGDAFADELSQHAERFADVFEDAAIGMATLTLQGRVVRSNRALRRLVVGEDTDPVVGSLYADLLGEDRAVAEALARVHDGDLDVVEVEHDLGRRRLRTTLSPVRDDRGRALYLFAQLQDVTAQWAAERELRQSERRFRLLVDAVRDYAIFMLDPGGHIASWNAGAQRSKGWTAEEIVGQHFGVFYPPEVVASGHTQRELELALRDGSYSEEGWRVRKDGSRFWAHVTITAVHDEDGHHVGFAKVTRDNTERHRLLQEQQAYAEALAEANARLEQANAKLAASADDQAQFLAVTAHELRTPISVMSMSGRTLAEHWHDLEDSERGELLDGLALGSAQLQRLLGDLLTASRIQASTLDLHLQDLDLTQVLTPVRDELRRLHDESDIAFHVPPGTVVRADAGRVVQIVQNLIGNALAHGAAPVELSVRQADRSEDDQERVLIEVRDAGAGVPAELVPRLFERFATRGSGGTGLGLHIVRALARAQQGDAWYDVDRDLFAVALLGRAAR